MRAYLSLVAFSHTVFALPFALVGFSLSWHIYGVNDNTTYIRLLLGVLGCMVFARSAAMGFNRYLDRDIDAINPRTTQREIPAGVIKPQQALLFVIVCCVCFVGCTLLINRLCLLLSPIALLVVLGYSYTKRFTPLCHLVLGAGLGLAPLGAWLAAGGGFEAIPLLIAFAVLCWVSGFDIIYALQDEHFDQKASLHSIPAWLGGKTALRVSEALHVVSALLMAFASWEIHKEIVTMGWLQYAALAIFIGMLVYQHLQVKVSDLSKVNRAFFTANGIASVIFGVLTLIDLWW